MIVEVVATLVNAGIGFGCATWAWRRSTRYMMGVRVCETIDEIIAQRRFIGRTEITVVNTREWDVQGHRWQLIVKQLPAKEEA